MKPLVKGAALTPLYPSEFTGQITSAIVLKELKELDLAVRIY